MYYVYVLEIKRNLKLSLKRATKTTKNYREIKLIYYEACIRKTDAIKRESQLKTGFGRGYLKRRLENYLSMRD